MSDTEGTTPPLPGLEDIDPRGVAYLERGVRRTLARLHELGHLDEEDAAYTAMAVELAQIIAKKKSSGKLSTVGNDVRAMIELLDQLVPAESAVDAGLAAAMAAWQEQTPTS